MNILINSNGDMRNYSNLQLIIPRHDVQVDKLQHNKPAKVGNQVVHITIPVKPELVAIT